MKYVEKISLFDDELDSTQNRVVEMKGTLNTISLFSGAGGLDLGLIKAGFNIVFANDILKPAIENYRHNIGEIFEGDITKINVHDWVLRTIAVIYI